MNNTLRAALAAVARPALRGGTKRLLSWLPLALVVALAGYGLAADTHPFWPLAVAVVVLPALPLSGAPSRGGSIGYLAFLVASIAAVSIVFCGEDRYHMVASPALCLLAACALRDPGERPAQPL